MFEFLNGKDKDDDSVLRAATGFSATATAQNMTQKAAETFAKPDTYTGNRNMFDSDAAKADAKRAVFRSGNRVKDPYTGEDLVLTKREAQMLYGDEWASHLAESDHINPLERVVNEHKNNVWNTTEDIKDAANSQDNLEVVSRRVNNAKRSRSNEEFLNDEEYLKSKGIHISDKNKKNGIKKGKRQAGR